METKSNNIDRYFRDRLGNYEQSPPDTVWEQILIKGNRRRKKKAIMIVFRIAAGMAVLISTGIGVYLLTRNNVPVKDTTAVVIAEDKSSEDKSSSQGEQIKQETSSIASVSKQQPGSRSVSKTQANTELSEEMQVTHHPQIIEVENEITVVERNKLEVEPYEITNDIPVDELQLAGIETTLIPDSLSRELRIPDRINVADSAADGTAVMLALSDESIEIPQTRKRKWSIGSELAPLYSDGDVRADNFDNLSQTVSQNESGILAYAGGLRVALNTGSRLSVQSGIYYSRYGRELDRIQTVAVSGESDYKFLAGSNSTGNIKGIIDTKAYYFSGNALSENIVLDVNDYKNGIGKSNVNPIATGDAEYITLRQYFDYFELPLILKYKIIDRKLDFGFSGGLITNLLVGNAVNMINDGESKQVAETSGIKKINYLGSVGMGFEVPVGGKFSFTLEPRFRYYLNQINQTSDIVVHPFSLGFFAGINYTF